MKTTTATTEAVGALDAATREIPKIDPGKVTLNTSGQAWQSYLVRLPDGMIGDDLKEPSIWAKVQGSKCSLRRYDHLLMIAADDTWLGEVIVADANADGVILAKPRITNLPQRFDNLPQTAEYAVVWSGMGYMVRRKSDGAAMSSPVHSISMAERDIMNLYPRRVA